MCFFFSLSFRDFLWWFFSWIFSLAMIWYTFLIAHNCNYLRLCYCSFICEAHAHESTTQVSPPLQFSFSSLKASLFTYISAASSLKFPWSIFLGNMSSWARYATATVCLCQPACLCLSVYLSRCLLKIETWGMCCGATATKLLLLLSRFFLLQKCAFSSQRASNLSSWHANSLLNEWASWLKIASR